MSSPGQGFALGVDLGTSNTVAVVRWPDGRTRPLLVDGLPLMPSGVFSDEHGRLHVGRDALRLAQVEPARYEPNPKRHVDEQGVLLGDREVPVVDLLAAILGAVARSAVEAVGFLPPAALTFPAAWGPHRRDVLSAAVARAGWPPVRMLPEPVAAARYFADVLRRPVPVGASLAVFDFGGGTVDVAVVRNEGSRFAVLGSGGIENLGGLDIDAALVEHLGAIMGPARPDVWRALTTPSDASQRRDRRALWDDVRGAKEMLSRASSAPVVFPGLPQAVHVTREELERVATPLLRRAVQETATVIRNCGLRPDELAGLFLVGGSSRLPLAARLLHTELGIAPTVLEQPELPVAEGALAELVPVTVASAALQPPAYRSRHEADDTAESITAPNGVPPVSGPPVSGMPSSPVPAAPQVWGQGGWQQPAGAFPPPNGVPPRQRRRRPRGVWIGAVAAAVVLALVATAGIVYWLRRDAPVSFQALQSTKLAVPFGEEEPSAAYSYAVGDRVYLGWIHDKQLEIVGVDLADQKRLWQFQAPDPVETWGGLYATGDGVVVLGYTSASAEPRPMYVLAPDTGRKRWQRDAFGEDVRYGFAAGLLVDSEKEATTRLLDWVAGRQKWQLAYRTTTSGSPLRTTTSPVLRGANFAGPSPFGGAADVGASGGDDDRVVQLDSERTLRVIDVASGKVTERKDVAAEETPRLAIDGRLYIVVSENGLQLRQYDLGKLGEPTVLYTQTDSAKRLVGQPRPCGDGLVCLLERASSDAKTTEIVAVDVADRKVAWRRGAAGTETLVPVGERVLATSVDGDPASLLFDAGGKQVLSTDDRKTVGVRVNAASLLLFSRAPTPYAGQPVALTGVTGGGDRHPLGSLDDVRLASCSWTTKHLACATSKEFRIWQFAS